jgi:hypothetical protein
MAAIDDAAEAGELRRRLQDANAKIADLEKRALAPADLKTLKTLLEGRLSEKEIIDLPWDVRVILGL